jgi:hypothetical protein
VAGFDNDVSGTYMVPMGYRSPTINIRHFTDVNNYKPGSLGSFNGDSSFALKKGDDKTPYTQNWNFIISQQLPGQSTLELQYAGNRTRDGLLTGNGNNRNFNQNLNKVPLGALFGSDPVTGNPCPANPEKGLACDPDKWSDSEVAHFRPYQNYGNALIEVTHGSYSNYHAMMMTWTKPKGMLTFSTNYTFSKLLGIRDGQSNNGGGTGTTVAPFNLSDNYGVLAYDHSHIFNASYILRLPSRVKSNPILAGIANGWEVSGITQVQSGPPLQPLTGGNMNAAIGVGTLRILGTDASAILMPYLTCDPRKGLKSGQSFNPNCFAAPTTVGVNGPYVWPYIRGPKYFNSDLSVYKNFKLTERQGVQFRMSAFNFLNHPLHEFGHADDLRLSLSRVDGQPDTTPLDKVKYTMDNRWLTGSPAYTAGRRVVEFALKYTF